MRTDQHLDLNRLGDAKAKGQIAKKNCLQNGTAMT